MLLPEPKLKNQIIAISIATRTSSIEELTAILQGKIDYLKSFYGNSPDNSVISDPEAHELYTSRYQEMVSILKGLEAATLST